jgi:hypothetical protein
MKKLIQFVMAATVIAFAPVSFAADKGADKAKKACDACCKDKGKECKACCEDAGKKCGTDCCKVEKKKK